MEGVVVLPLRVLRNHFTSVKCDREATFGQSSWTAQPLRWGQPKGTTPKGYTASLSASAAFDNA
jgi:hypothetical protein